MSRRHIGKRHHPGFGEPAVHFQQESRNFFHRGLAAQQQHMVFGVPEVACGHGPEVVGDLDIRSCGGFQAAALHQADGGVGDRFGRQAMGRAGVEAEHVTGQMERADLAPSVGKQLVGANCAADHLIDIFARLALAVDILILPVGKLAGNHTHTGRDHAELVDGRNRLGAGGGENLGRPGR